MKKILITAKNSYIGNAFALWVSGKYSVDFISCRSKEWKQVNFSQYDVIFHVAGIAHVDAKSDMESQYYKVNRDLTIELAKKAKEEGIKQFIFMSSIIVYGESSSRRKIIYNNTIPKPSNFYGNSKLQAEEGIKRLESDDFKVVIIRPPMIYGKGSKGNYPKLAKLAQKIPVFPDIDNQRSMLHIDNLCEFIRFMIDNEESGLFFPQNSEYVKTSEMVKLIAEAHKKKIRLLKVFNPILKFFGKYINFYNKVFGDMVYDKGMSAYKNNYQLKDLKESIFRTEVS